MDKFKYVYVKNFGLILFNVYKLCMCECWFYGVEVICMLFYDVLVMCG